jgi:metal-responsive CopG/Arc/MetJ family transcriptional regulator
MVIMVKITINVDDDLWKLFSLIVMHERGRGKRNEVIVELIKDYVERSSLPTNEKQLEYILQIEEERKAF